MKEGMIVFYIDNGLVYSGKMIEIEETDKGCLFSIDNYGDCSGQHRISSAQIGRTVFFSEEDAELAAR